jgi:hypothetical protein
MNVVKFRRGVQSRKLSAWQHPQLFTQVAQGYYQLDKTMSEIEPMEKF